MNDDLRSLVEETRELTIENHKILKSMQKRARMGMLMHSVYWIIILVVGVGSFYYLEPYINEVKGAYEGLKSAQNKLSELGQSFGNFKNFVPK